MPGAFGGRVVTDVAVGLHVEGIPVFELDEGGRAGLGVEFAGAEGDAGR